MTAEIRLGTSSFTATGWQGAFYPVRLKQADYLSFYSGRFDTVEIDSTFYGIPTVEAVENWARKTPPGFIFSVKIPRTITHEKILIDCDAECEQFIRTMSTLAKSLGRWYFSSRTSIPMHSTVLRNFCPGSRHSSRSFPASMVIGSRWRYAT